MREPTCPYFALPDTGFRGKCGGCVTQHIPYEVQIENKKNRAVQVLKFDDVQVFSGEEFYYRNRMDMVFAEEGIGFRQKKSWRWRVAIRQCAISNARLNELIKEMWEHFEDVDDFEPKEHTGTYRYAVIRTPQNDSCISFVLNKDSSKCGEAIERIEDFAKKTTSNNILVTYMPAKTDMSYGEEFIVIKGSDILEETLMGRTFRYSAQGFFQNNTEMAERMHEYVHGLLKSYDKSEYAHLLDLYGGVGTFGVINADLFKSVMTVEAYEGCTVAAKANIELNGIENCEAINMDAKQVSQLNLSKGPLYVVTDPPRSGMHPKTIEGLVKAKPEVIIYISCNIKQLEKDMPKFLKHYKLKSAAIFDLFPQTNHMETVVELVK
ncbi:23S rRNA (uracil(1939)-C(5))-methyltransferase RlmD [candidate division KSB1 bacterium]